MTEATDAPPCLKLRAETAEDLTVFSAVLQDAVTVIGDMTFRPKEHRFAIMANRYLWERNGGSGDCCQRIRSGIHFDGVLNAHLQGLSQRAKAKVLELLALHFTPGEDGGGTISLVFAGGGAIHLQVECVDGYLSDVGAPWKARCRPAHASAES